MISMRLILRALEKPRMQQVPLSPPSVFNKLPQEIIFYIADFLPLESAGVFTICCRHIYLTLGRSYLDVLKTKKGPALCELLALLERGLPDYCACRYCPKLHKLPKRNRVMVMQLWELRRKTLKCMCTEFAFRLGMKLHRQGRDRLGTAALRLLDENQTGNWGSEKWAPGYYDFQKRIVNGSMFLRGRNANIISRPGPQSLGWSWTAPCLHLNRLDSTMIDDHGNLIFSRLASWATPEHDHGERLKQCGYCETEFQVDIVEKFDGCSPAIFMAYWRDIGEGRTWHDPKWTSDARIQSAGSSLPEPVTFARGSICAALEGQESSRYMYDSILTPAKKIRLIRNAKISRKQRYPAA